MQCVEKVLWLTECIKSGLQTFVLEINNAPWLGRPVEVDQIKILVKNIKCCILWEIEDIFKISKWRVENNLYQLGYVSCCSDGKESACNVGDAGLIPGSGRSLGKGNGNPLQYSHLANPMDIRAWQAIVCGVTKSQIWLSDWHLFMLITLMFGYRIS